MQGKAGAVQVCLCTFMDLGHLAEDTSSIRCLLSKVLASDGSAVCNLAVAANKATTPSAL